jgi:hypothetical protein
MSWSSSFRFLLVVILSVNLSCSKNLFDEMGNKSANESLLQDVKIYLNNKNYDAAVARCQGMSASYLAQTEPTYYCASALAGRCGLDMVDLIFDFTNYSSPPSYMQFFMNRMDAGDAEIDACQDAEDLIAARGVAAARTTNENLLMTLIGLQKLGVIARRYADTDDNGAVDPTYNNGCDPTQLPDAAVQKLGSAYWHLNESAALSGIPGVSALTTIITTACSALDILTPGSDFCGAAGTPGAFNAQQLKAVRILTRSENATFGLECAGNFSACLCP